MDTREFKSSLYKQLAKVTKALSNPHRLEILDLLAQGSFSVEYIAENANMSVANASQHLQVLKKSGLVDTVRDGKYIFYELYDGRVLETWRALRQLGLSRNQEINELLEDYRQRKDQMNLMSSDELFQKLKNNEVYLVDVRPEEEYNLGHIKQAGSLPHKQLKERLQELPTDREIVAYCRGPLCLMADEAVALMRKEGLHATRLENGFADWLAEERPVEITDK
ncbi:ArsR/SmtB family transcription factor [Rhodohalobacter sp. 8-1]|uniref:ArsR/SmtB family transcription factor n=1 Tax=Rhodohalobacter sp. 8-1 TaxID=3131972 RepID=UPI0030EBBC50